MISIHAVKKEWRQEKYSNDIQIEDIDGGLLTVQHFHTVLVDDVILHCNLGENHHFIIQVTAYIAYSKQAVKLILSCNMRYSIHAILPTAHCSRIIGNHTYSYQCHLTMHNRQIKSLSTALPSEQFQICNASYPIFIAISQSCHITDAYTYTLYCTEKKNLKELVSCPLRLPQFCSQTLLLALLNT